MGQFDLNFLEIKRFTSIHITSLLAQVEQIGLAVTF
jgi:hypothetical protein